MVNTNIDYDIACHDIIDKFCLIPQCNFLKICSQKEILVVLKDKCRNYIFNILCSYFLKECVVQRLFSNLNDWAFWHQLLLQVGRESVLSCKVETIHKYGYLFIHMQILICTYSLSLTHTYN